MKTRYVLLTILLCVTATVISAASCRQLGITVLNETEHTCLLKNVRLDQGKNNDQIPVQIEAHSQSPIFYFSQDEAGIGVMLDYRCGDKVVVFYSMQEHCFITAGVVQGFSYLVNELQTDHLITEGSAWHDTPGEIRWRIY